MNSRLIAKLASWLAIGGVLVASSTTAATSLTACGESGACTNLREQTYANLEVWQACDPTSLEPGCIIEAGNPRDCTGVLSCDFAVNAKYRADAEQRVYSIGEASQGCYLCAVPNCISAQIAVCEPVSRRCMGVTAVVDGGLMSGTLPPTDSGGIPVIPFDAAGIDQ